MLKAFLGILAFYLIYLMIRSRTQGEFQAFIALFKKKQIYGVLIIAFILMILNWWVEALKWKFLVTKVERISLRKSCESLLAGLNLAIFTPARIGEYGGRILYLKPENRKKGILCILVGNFAQLMVTLILGSVGGFFWVKAFIPLNPFFLFGLGFLLSGLSACFLIAYYRIGKLINLFNRIPFLKKFANSLLVLEEFSKKELSGALVFSLIRYGLFSNQYLVLLFALLGYHSYGLSLSCLSLILLTQSIIPSFVLADMGIRGVTSIYFFSFVFGKQNIIPILATAFYIWLVNIIFPAILGIFYVLKVKEPFGHR